MIYIVLYLQRLVFRGYINLFPLIFLCTGIEPYVLLKTLPPVCIKYTARAESPVVNTAQGKAECYICQETLNKSCILSY